MKIMALIRTALRSILKNRMRSILTSLGIIIGVLAVIVMVGVGEGSRAQIQDQIGALGSNLLIVFPGSRTAGGVSLGAGSRNSLTLDDVDRLREEASLLAAISPVVVSSKQVVGGSGNWNTRVYGIMPEFMEIRKWNIKYGTAIAAGDVKSKRKVAVIGSTVADELFPGEDPTGERIRIGNIPFMVMGVLEKKGQSGMGQDQDDIVLAPFSTVLYRMKGGTYLDMINLSVQSTNQMDAALDQVTRILRSSHRLPPGEDDDFRVLNQAEIIQKMDEVTGILTMLLGSVAAVSLVVGGIGIMNIMLVSVTERTREIGIRLSVGARKNDILVQFLVEAIILSLSGGIIGIALAFFVSFALTRWVGLSTIIELKTVALSFLFAGAVGVFFGFYPARKAASLNPIEALRYE